MCRNRDDDVACVSPAIEIVHESPGSRRYGLHTACALITMVFQRDLVTFRNREG